MCPCAVCDQQRSKAWKDDGQHPSTFLVVEGRQGWCHQHDNKTTPPRVNRTAQAPHFFFLSSHVPVPDFTQVRPTMLSHTNIYNRQSQPLSPARPNRVPALPAAAAAAAAVLPVPPPVARRAGKPILSWSLIRWRAACRQPLLPFHLSLRLRPKMKESNLRPRPTLPSDLAGSASSSTLDASASGHKKSNAAKKNKARRKKEKAAAAAAATTATEIVPAAVVTPEVFSSSCAPGLPPFLPPSV